MIIESLEDLISICKNLNCQFRVFGSLIPAALKGEFYRKVGDVDCFIDNAFGRAVSNELGKKGYKKLTGKDEDVPPFLHCLGLRTKNFIKDNDKLSLLFVSFKEKYMEIPLKSGLSFRTPYHLINRDYKFYGKEFKGLIPEAALFNVLFFQDKTKRKIDFDVLFSFCNFDTIRKLKDTDTFFWFNKRIPLISRILASRIDKFLPNQEL